MVSGGLAILGAVASLAVTGILGHPVRYDQRQEGDLNIRTDVEDVVLVVVPPKDLIGSGMEFIASSLLKKNSDVLRPERWHYRPYSKWAHSGSSKAPLKIDLGKSEFQKKRVVHHGDPNRYNIRDGLPVRVAPVGDGLDQLLEYDITTMLPVTMRPETVPSDKASMEATSKTESKTVKKYLTKEEAKEMTEARLSDKDNKGTDTKSEETKGDRKNNAETKFPEKVPVPDTKLQEHDSKNTETKVVEPKVPDTKLTPAKVADSKFENTRVPEVKVPETKISGAISTETKFDETKVAGTKLTESTGETGGSAISGTKFAEVKVADVQVLGTKFADIKVPDVHTSGIKLPDVTQPFARLPNAQVPGTKSADIKVTETESDVKVPEIGVKGPDAKTVATKSPDGKTPQIKIVKKEAAEADDVPRVLGELSPGSLGPTSIFSREGCGPDAYRDIRGICIYKKPSSN